MNDDKRLLRNLKRDIKKKGNRRVRRGLQQALRDNPDEAHWDEVDYGKDSSVPLNGLDRPAENPAQ